jgi:FtsH-binding integral membrane protein
MKEDAVRAYRFNILKVYALVYSLVAIPILYYGINYIQLVNGHLAVSLPLFCIVMALSVVAAFAVQSRSNRHIRPFLEGKEVRSEEFPLMIKNACAYPLRLVLVMVTGWIVMVNLIVLLPLFFYVPLERYRSCRVQPHHRFLRSYVDSDDFFHFGANRFDFSES